MSGDTRVTSTNSMLFLLCNGQLTLGHTFSLPTFVNMLLCRFHEIFLPSEEELMWTFDADYVNDNNHRKHAKRSNNGVPVPRRVLGRVRNGCNV